MDQRSVAGQRPNGYISFRYELTSHLNYGRKSNVLVVKVDNSKQPNSRWYSGSGIYRNVWLTTLDKLHIRHWGTFVTTPKVSAHTAEVSIQTKVNSAYTKEQPFVLTTTVYDAVGKPVKNVSSHSTATPGIATTID